jgi:hypothetical protein
MFRFDAGARRPAEYSILVEPRPAGPAIGVYAGLPITERVVDLFGRRFSYVGVACRRRDGQFEVTSLKPGEFIVQPGLVYCLERANPASQDAAKSDRSDVNPPPQLRA